MKEERLGEVLLSQGLISQTQLDKALKAQKDDPERLLGHILVEQGALSYSKLVTTIVEHQHMPLAQALLKRREQANQPVDEHGIPLLRVSEEEAKKLAMPAEEFPLPLPKPSLHHFHIDSETERELAEDAFEVVARDSIEEARQIITQGSTILPDSQTMQYLISWLLTMDGKVDTSIMSIKRNLPDYLTNASALWLMAYNLQYQQKDREAIEHYQRLLRQEKPHRDWYFSMAYSMDKLGYKKKARQIYTHFIRITRGENKYTWYARERLREIIEKYDTD